MLSRLRIARFSSVMFCAFMGLSSLGWANEPRIAVSKSPLSLPFFVAAEKNLFAKHKVEPVLIECLGGNRCVKELTEGRVDMATSSELPFMFAVFQGKPISLVTTFNTNKDDMKFLIRKAAVKGGVKDLAGKRIGYVEKASSHYYMDLFLLYNGIDPKSTVPVAMGAAMAVGVADSLTASPNVPPQSEIDKCTHINKTYYPPDVYAKFTPAECHKLYLNQKCQKEQASGGRTPPDPNSNRSRLSQMESRVDSIECDLDQYTSPDQRHI